MSPLVDRLNNLQEKFAKRIVQKCLSEYSHLAISLVTKKKLEYPLHSAIHKNQNDSYPSSIRFPKSTAIAILSSNSIPREKEKS